MGATALFLAFAVALVDQAPQMELSEEVLDLGKLGRGETTSAVLEIRSVGDAALEVYRVGVECRCAELDLRKNGIAIEISRRNQGRVNLRLEPGESAELRLTVDTTDWSTGVSEYDCMLFHNAGGGPQRVQFRFEVDEDIEPRAPVDGDAPPRLFADPPLHDFGTVFHGERSRAEFHLANAGANELVLFSIRAQCKCLRLELIADGETLGHDALMERGRSGEVLRLAAGGAATLRVEMDSRELDPATLGPSFRKGVRLRGNDPRRPELTLDLRAVVVPSLQVVPSRLRLEGVRKGEVVEAEVRVHSERLQNYRLDAIRSTAPQILDAGIEQVESGERPVYSLRVRFVATAVGSVQEALLLELTHSEITDWVLPVYAEVVPAVEFRSESSALEGRIDFGKMAAGTRVEAVLDVRNHEAQIPYRLERATLEGRFEDGDVSAEIEEIESGQHYRVRVFVEPRFTQRFLQGRLRLHAQHPDLPVHEVSLRGFRVDR